MRVDYRTIRNLLPEGRTLPGELWALRHRGILVLLRVHAALIPVFALVRGFSVIHTIVESSVVPLSAVVARSPNLSRRVRGAAASLGLLSCSAVLVHHGILGVADPSSVFNQYAALLLLPANPGPLRVHRQSSYRW